MMKNSNLNLPKEDIWDYLYKGNQIALSVFPPAKVFYELLVAPPIKIRTADWMKNVKEAIEKLEKIYDGFKIESLVNNELFQSALISSTRIAATTHQKEKLEALRNALLNTIIMKDLEENFKLLFFNYIDSMTILHLHVLKFFEEPRAGEGQLDREYGPYFIEYTHMYEKDVEMDTILFTSMCKDLETKGLLKRGRKIDKDSPFSKPHPTGGAMKSPTGHFQWIMHSELGSKFYYFIISPEDLNL